jgi:hypothetical protein
VDGGGVWLWGGGDTSQNVSSNMDDEFWRPDYTDSDYGPGYTSCAQWQEWVLLPNNWIFDTDFGAYWRLDYPAEIASNSATVVGTTAVHNWTVDWKGRHAYGFLDHMADNSTYEIIGYDYDRLDPRHTYSWQSQPMSATIDRAVKIRQCILTVSGSAGTVTVKIRSNKTGSEATLTYTHGVESAVDDDFPTAYAQACHVIGSHVQVQITSTATTNTDPAPVVHGFRLGLDQHAQFPR